MAGDARVSVPAKAALASAAGAHGRPRAVTFVALLLILEGLVALGVGALYVAGWMIDPDAMRTANLRLMADSATLFSLSGVGLLVASIGLLLRRAWAWTLAMATQCLTLTVTLYEYLSNDPDYLVMALGVLAVLLLNRQEVRVAFEPAEHHRG
jgi:lysylphosphatidylglycerol synthetase-like protein (DUF2156 family)